MTKLAVVLFNLGGPDRPEAVRPFLRNLFDDPAIIGLPAVVRTPLAVLISGRREQAAKANYALMGGRSPILPETEAQARALDKALAARRPDLTSKTFIAMRYWNPRAKETAAQVAAFEPDEIVLLPLYPQYSTTTTASSLKDWRRAYRGSGRSRAVCCYPLAEGFLEAHARRIRDVWEGAGAPANVRLLFSAHGLPKKVIERGDPYQAQVEAAAAGILERLGGEWDSKVCYQSRVGPLKWLEPSTESAIREAAADGKGVLIAPIAFVSEHVETLVELDHEYAAVAKEIGCAPYLRVPTLGVHAEFVDALAGAALEALDRDAGASPSGAWICPAAHGKCGRGGER